MSKEIVAFIGLGVMGYPMAGHLANAGYSTRVYNRTTAKAEQWCKDYHGSWAATPREAAEDADFVFICVGNDDDLRSVVYGEDGVLAGITDGAILVDHTTASANVAREISNQSQVPFLDAPVSG
ncbi:MAG: NAD(P)-dependent oxidoreductase, partial [Gammaproteobacteria bacterium]|nr:NAD(P)-dependent oxidoreductase [Gammaproteobacteria bacterium]